jgi:hypothetical protein
VRRARRIHGGNREEKRRRRRCAAVVRHGNFICNCFFAACRR